MMGHRARWGLVAVGAAIALLLLPIMVWRLRDQPHPVALGAGPAPAPEPPDLPEDRSRLPSESDDPRAAGGLPLRDSSFEAQAQLAVLADWVERAQGFSNDDPRIERCARALVGQIATGLAAWSAHHGRHYVRVAIRLAVLKAVAPGDRQVVSAHLRSHPWLVAAVEAHGWVAEVHDQLRAGLEEGIDTGLNLEDVHGPGGSDWPAALALSARGDEYALLADCLVRGRDGARQAHLVERLRKLPGFDWQAAVRRAWERFPPTDYIDRQQGLAALAREAGAGNRLPARIPAAVPVMAARSPGSGFTSGPDGKLIPRAMKPASPRPTAAPATLDASSSRADVDAWIDARAAEAPPKGATISYRDPMVGRLAAIPAQHYQALLEAMERTDSWSMCCYLEAASLRAARPDHRVTILALLPRFPHLAEAVVAQHWEADALPLARAWLAAGNAAQNMGVAKHMLTVVARAGNAQDHPRLRTTLVQERYGYHQADYAAVLATVPGFDLAGAVREAWRYRPEADYGDRQEGFCLVAARHGVAGALPLVIATAADAPDLKHRSGARMKACRAWLQEQFGLDPAEADYRAWFATAQPLLGWDAEARRWRLPPGQVGPATADPGF